MKKNRLLKILVCMLALIIVCCALSACNKKEEMSYDYLITFDYNEGNLTTSPIEDQYVGVNDGCIVAIRPGFKEGEYSIVEQSISGYYLEGWYLPMLDENGNVVMVNQEGKTIDETGEDKDDAEIAKKYSFVKLGAKWNFASDRVTEDMVKDVHLGEQMVKGLTLYANFKHQYSLHYVERSTGKEYGVTMAVPGTQRKTPTAPVKEGWTFLGKYYASQDSDVEFSWPYVFNEEHKYVYVDFIEGAWNLVSTDREFNSAFNGGKNIWLLNDIDYTGKTPWSNLTTYNGKINGNGHTISNVKNTTNIKKSKPAPEETSAGGLFGTLGKDSYIYDINFENVDYRYTMSFAQFTYDVYAGLFAWKAIDGAKIENVTVSGTMEYVDNGFVHADAWVGSGNLIMEGTCENTGVLDLRE